MSFVNLEVTYRVAMGGLELLCYYELLSGMSESSESFGRMVIRLLISIGGNSATSAQWKAVAALS